MIYIYIFLVSMFFAYLAERSKNKGIIILCSIISILIPSILGGLRAYGVGTDTYVYGRPSFLDALASPNLAYFFNSNRLEPMCKLIIYFSAHVLGHENWSYFLYNLTTVSCFYIGAYKHKKFCSLPLLMFVFYMMWYNYTYNAMRQCIAASIVFMGFDTLENKQYFRFLVYVTIATLFHYSSVIAIVFLFCPYLLIASKKFYRYKYVKTFILCSAIMLVFFARTIGYYVVSSVPFLAQYSGYLTNYDEDNIQKSYLLITLGELIMLALYHRGASLQLSVNKTSKYNFEFFIYNLIIIATVTSQITIRYITKRFLLYSHFVNLIVLASLPKFVKEKKLRIIILLCVIVVSVFFWWKIYIRGGSSETWPYRSILD